MAKPTYALLPSGSYVALHHARWLAVIAADGVEGFDVVCGAPGQEALHYLYTWSAYPVASEETDFRAGAVLSVNEVAAHEMLERIMIHLAEDAGGLIVIDDLAADIVQEMGLEATPQTPETTTPGLGSTGCPGCGEFYTPQEWAAWEDWQGELAGKYVIVGIGGSDVSLKHCCEACADAYFDSGDCFQVTADGSMEAA